MVVIIEIDPKSLSIYTSMENCGCQASVVLYLFFKRLHISFIWIIFVFESTQIYKKKQLIQVHYWQYEITSSIRLIQFPDPQIEHWESVTQQCFKIISWIYFSAVGPCWFHNMPANRGTCTSFAEMFFIHKADCYLPHDSLILNFFERQAGSWVNFKSWFIMQRANSWWFYGSFPNWATTPFPW